MCETPVVDIHAHFFPTGMTDFSSTTGDPRWPSLVVDDCSSHRLMRGSEVFRIVKKSCFDVDERIRDLDDAGVDKQVISPVPVTFVDWAPAREAARFLADQNDRISEAAAASQGRLLPMGALALQDPSMAVAELERIRANGMVGVEIPACPAGRELDDPALDMFWEAAAGLQFPVFVHPAHQRTAIRRTGQPFENGLGMLTDTALAASALVYGGVLDRHPLLRVGLAHGCGSFAWVHPRLRYFVGFSAEGDADLDEFDEKVRRLWADSLVFDPAHFDLLCERFGADHIMLGTDHPFLPEGMEAQIGLLGEAATRSPVTPAALGRNTLSFLGLG